LLDPSARATPQPKPSTHRYPLGAQQPRRFPGGGAQWTVTANEFPISATLCASVLEIEPGALRELHWHPLTDEWQYYLEGAAEMAVYSGMGNTVTEQFVTGDIGYVPTSAGHYIRNTGSGILRMVIGFNNGHHHAEDLNAWLASTPPDVRATDLGLPLTLAEALAKETHIIAGPRRPSVSNSLLPESHSRPRIAIFALLISAGKAGDT
jgi:oxalate decarboxylase